MAEHTALDYGRQITRNNSKKHNAPRAKHGALCLHWVNTQKQRNDMKKTEEDKDIVHRMVTYYREWYTEWTGAIVQYSSKLAYVKEYNTMKGIFNMLMGSYRAHNPKVIPGDDIIYGMWQRMLGYIREKKMYFYTKLLTIHGGYNVLVAMMMRHAEKERTEATKKRKQEADKMQQKLSIVQEMLGVKEEHCDQ